jgi:uncharacterized membrane protein
MLDFKTLAIIIGIITAIVLIFLSIYLGVGDKTPEEVKDEKLRKHNEKVKKIIQERVEKQERVQQKQEEKQIKKIQQNEEIFRKITAETEAAIEEQLIDDEDKAIAVAEQPRTNEEVFEVGKNVYTYMDASKQCAQLGTRLATREELNDAYEKGADWCNLGWVQDIEAYYPSQVFDTTGRCGGKGLNGGRIPSEVKLGAVCYGLKPPKNVAGLKSLQIQPFNKEKWSQLE